MTEGFWNICFIVWGGKKSYYFSCKNNCSYCGIYCGYHGNFFCDYLWVMCVTLLCSSFQSDGLFTLMTDIGHLNMNASYSQDQNKKTWYVNLDPDRYFKVIWLYLSFFSLISSPAYFWHILLIFASEKMIQLFNIVVENMLKRFS